MRKPKIVPDSVLKTALRGSVPHGKLRNAKIKLVNPDKRAPIAGMVKYRKGKDEVEEIVVPRGGGMFSTAINEHEGTHASVSGKRRKRPAVSTELEQEIIQIVEDCYVEQLPLPKSAGPSYKRRRLFPGMKDLLSMLRAHRRAGEQSVNKTVQQRNGDILIGARCLAIARCYGSYDVAGKVEAKIASILGPVRFQGVDRAVDDVKHGRATGKTRAIKILSAIVEAENEDELERQPPNRDGDKIDEGTLQEKGMVKMDVIVLKPAGASTAREKALSVRYAPTGVLINQARMSHAIISGDSTGLFLRRRKLEAGGVVLIDASGSMNCTAKNLTKLCQLIPAAIVAFYSGYDSSRGGKLCLYARNRKRFSGTEHQLEQFMMGGNCVDLPALRWLSRLNGPRYLVTDRQYCGGAWGDAIAAQTLTDSMLNRGQLVLIPSFEMAINFFDKSSALNRQVVELFGRGPHKSDCHCKACYSVMQGDYGF